MGHLVDHDPVVAEIGLGRVAADDQAYGSPAIAERRALFDAAARRRHDQDSHRGDREPAVIDRHRLRRCLEPGDQRVSRQREFARGECDLERSTADFDGYRRQTVGRLIRKGLAEELGLGVSGRASDRAKQHGWQNEPRDRFRHDSTLQIASGRHKSRLCHARVGGHPVITAGEESFGQSRLWGLLDSRFRGNDSH